MAKQQTYRFYREDTGEPVEVDFATMMGQDVAGYITLPDGVQARRDRSGPLTAKTSEPPPGGRGFLPPSDNLGFQQGEFAEKEADRVAHGFTGVEFVRDPHEPSFFQVRCADWRTFEKYAKHRKLVVRNRHSGACIDGVQLKRVKQRFSREK